MFDWDKETAAAAKVRLRSAAVISDYQMERAARDTAKRASHLFLGRFPELRDLLPWIRRAACPVSPRCPCDKGLLRSASRSAAPWLRVPA